MKFFIDTAKVEDIKAANDMGVICGVTTNPSLIAKEGRDFKEVIKEITSIVDGPISGEVKATTTDAEDHVIIKAADEAIDMQIPRMDSEYSMGYKLTMELLDEGREFTAIAGQNDMMAIGALDALHEARIHVPKDVSVIGCDNIFYSGIRKISLTTIDHFVALKGRDACDIILRKIDEQDRFLTDSAPVSLYNIEYTPKLIARRTTGYVRTKKNN